jgi:hypothetical protein
MITILRGSLARNIWVATLKVKVTAWPCSKIVSGQYLHYLKSDFTTISQKWSPYWDDLSPATFGSLPWRSRWPCSKIMSGPYLCYLKSDFTTISQKWSPYWDNVSSATFRLFLHFELCLCHNSDTTRGIPSCVHNLFGEHHPVQPALV